MKIKITKRAVDAAKPAAKDSFLWDTETKGFGLKLTPAGRKVYVLQYRLHSGPARRFTIGLHGAPWTPERARARAAELLGDVAKGVDPALAKRASKSDISVWELCELYLAEGVHTKKAATVSMDRSRIDSHVVPLLGRKRLKALAKADIERFMADVAAGKTAKDVKHEGRGRSIVTGGSGVANRTLGMLGAILEFAVDRGLIEYNPARGVKRFKEAKRERYLSAEELARLGEELRRSEENNVNPYAIAAIRLLLFTGCRRSEILTLQWKEVDFEGGFLRLEDSKTGAKNIYLTAPAKEILSAIPRLKNNPYVIVGDVAGRHMPGLQKIWAGIRERAGLKGVRLHDLRHSFASIGARSGESLLVIGKLLGHSTTTATARYAHLSDDPVMGAAESIASEVAASLAGKKAPIVSLKEGRKKRL